VLADVPDPEISHGKKNPRQVPGIKSQNKSVSLDKFYIKILLNLACGMR
jgi:hypothetical protein